MTGLDNILKLAQMQQNIHKSFGLSSQIADMLKAQERITKSFSGVSMLTEITKSMQHYKAIASPTMSAIEAMTKSMSILYKLIINGF